MMKVEEHDYLHCREIAGHGLCGVARFLFTTGLVLGIEETGYRGRYCYEHRMDAIGALMDWNGIGDPPGPWIKYKGEGGERSNNHSE